MAGYTSQLWLMLGALILAVGLPFVAVLILDGFVAIFRRQGVGSLGGAIVMTLVVGGLGWALWAVGMDQLADAGAGAAYASQVRLIMRWALIVTVPLALLSFLVRTAWAIGHRRPRY